MADHGLHRMGRGGAKRDRVANVEAEPPKVLVLSRAEAQLFRGQEPYVLISIRSQYEPLLHLRPDVHRLQRINLEFSDTTPEWETLPSAAKVMTEQQADRIARLIRKHGTKVLIVVHCRHGVSRSAGVAAGVALAFGRDATLFLDKRHDPNPHVTRLVRSAICRAGTTVT